jgi:hypothetical protein
MTRSTLGDSWALGSPTRERRRGRRLGVIAVLTAATLSLSGIALADDVANNLDSSVDATSENMNLIAGGATGSVQFHLSGTTGDDAKPGCNLGGPASQLVLGISSSDTSVASLSTSSVTITGCDPTLSNTIVVTPVGAGTATVTVSFTSVTTNSAATNAGDYRLAPASFTVTVASGSTPNSPPTVDAGGPYAGAEGSDIALDGASASDTDGSVTDTVWSIQDDTGVSPGSCTLANAGSLDSATISCTDDGSATVRLTATDDDGASSTSYATVEVSNVAPSVDAAFGSAVDCGPDNATLTLTFQDPGAADTHTASIDWDGDGIVDETVDPATSGSTRSHTFPAGVTNTTDVTVTDDDGDAGSDDDNAVTVNYDTSGILQPVNWTQAHNDPSIFKYGSTVPVKVQFFDCDGTNAGSGLSVSIRVKKLNPTPPPDGYSETVANTNSPDSGGSMRWADPVLLYNLNTKSLSDSSATYEITLTVGSTGQTVITNFGTKAK